eukprot:1590742-Prymnesium_polylepis.1
MHSPVGRLQVQTAVGSNTREDTADVLDELELIGLVDHDEEHEEDDDVQPEERHKGDDQRHEQGRRD